MYLRIRDPEYTKVLRQKNSWCALTTIKVCGIEKSYHTSGERGEKSPKKIYLEFRVIV